jgi:CubicO group peptidase (beta-lactamase class C family)
MLKNLKAAVTVSFVVLLAGCAQEASDPYNEAFRTIDQVVRVAMEEEGTPGLALAITSEDRLLYVGHYGYADLTHRTPVTDQTLFQIGSISKSFTALALMHLWDEGVFDPQKPVREYLPWWDVQTEFELITGHHLLTHTSGIPANRDDIYGSPYMAWALREQAAAWPPGEKFHYSNVGYQTLHFLLEELSDEAYADLVGRLILEPLGMGHTNAAITLETRSSQAVGYVTPYDDRPHHPSRPLVEAPFMEYGLGDGCIQSTAADMAAYMRMLMKRGQGPASRIVSEAAFDLFTTPHFGGSDEDRSAGYGYGMGVSSDDEHNYLKHSGGMVGLYANMEIDLNDSVGVVVLVNGPVRWRNIFDYTRDALRAAARGDSPPPLPEQKDPTLVENATDYAGEFTTGSGATFVFKADGSRLLLHHEGDTIVLESFGKNSFYTPHPDFDRYAFNFGRNEQETVVEVTHGPDWFTNERYAGPTHYEILEAWSAYTGRYRSYSPWFPYFEIFTRKGQLLAVIGVGSETGSGEMLLQPRGEGVFHPGEDPTPELLRFEDVVDGQALRAAWSGHEFFRISW